MLPFESAFPPHERHYRFNGIPTSKGSWRALRNRKTGQTMLVPMMSKGLRAWTKALAVQAAQHGLQPVDGCLSVRVEFWMPAPARVRGLGWALSPGRNDIDKLLRAVFDGLKGLAWHDDSQIVEVGSRKLWSETPGMDLTIVELFG